jgi:hypothetical protein
MFVSLISSSYILTMVVRFVKKQNSQCDRYRSEIWRNRAETPWNDEYNVSRRSFVVRMQNMVCAIFTDTSKSADNHEEPTEQGRRGSNTLSSFSRNTRSRLASARRVQDVKQQAIFFISAFISTRLFTVINRITEQFLGTSPIWINVIAKSLLGLNGVVNILVYTKPHVTSLFRSDPEMSWLKAFIVVVKKGGDSDKILTRRRNSSVLPRGSVRARRSGRRLSQGSTGGEIKSTSNTKSGPLANTIEKDTLNQWPMPLKTLKSDQDERYVDDGDINDDEMAEIMKTAAFLKGEPIAEEDEDEEDETKV